MNDEDVEWQWVRSDTAGGEYSDVNGATTAAHTPAADSAGKYLRAKASYTDGHGPGKTATSGETKIVTGNAAPVFQDDQGAPIPDGAGADRIIAENSAAGANAGAPVAATDPDQGDTLTHALSGPDAGSFDIDNTGQITVGAGTMLDAEGTQTTYTVTVTATDPSGAADTIEVTIRVENVSLGAAADAYDANKNEMIEEDEAVAAVRDYFTPSSTLTKEDVINILLLYSPPR